MDPLDRANQIAVVLGGGISAHGDADPATIARTQAAGVLAHERRYSPSSSPAARAASTV